MLAGIVRSYPEPALVVGPSGVCTSLNSPAAGALGLPSDRVRGIHAHALGLPAEVATLVHSLALAGRAAGAEEREVRPTVGGEVRTYRLTPHAETGEVLVTWGGGPSTDSRAPAPQGPPAPPQPPAATAPAATAPAATGSRPAPLARLGTGLQRVIRAILLISEGLREPGAEVTLGQEASTLLDGEARHLQALLELIAQPHAPESGAVEATADDAKIDIHVEAPVDDRRSDVTASRSSRPGA